MTLCAAWIRHGKGDQGEELVFVTDSRLRGGEAWDSGVKLFDLGREDCLLCFAGDTRRAYPLILHGLNSPRFNVDWRNPRLDITDVLASLCYMFTELCTTIDDLYPGASIHEVSAEAEFLFGGWSWRNREFVVWKISYSQDLGGFKSDSWPVDDPGRIFIFLGDEVDIADQLLNEELVAAGKRNRGALDMEPLKVVSRMSRDQQYTSIGGALQVAKVYRSGHSEFFGMLWKSEPYFMGRRLNLYDAPPMRYLDPDTAQFVDPLPQHFADLDAHDFGDEKEFVRQCYDATAQLKKDLSDAHRERLQRIFRDKAYRDFLRSRDLAEQQAVSNNEAGVITSPEDVRET